MHITLDLYIWFVYIYISLQNTFAKNKTKLLGYKITVIYCAVYFSWTTAWIPKQKQTRHCQILWGYASFILF